MGEDREAYTGGEDRERAADEDVEGHKLDATDPGATDPGATDPGKASDDDVEAHSFTGGEERAAFTGGEEKEAFTGGEDREAFTGGE
jgi:hypothetical protein